MGRLSLKRLGFSIAHCLMPREVTGTPVTQVVPQVANPALSPVEARPQKHRSPSGSEGVFQWNRLKESKKLVDNGK